MRRIFISFLVLIFIDSAFAREVNTDEEEIRLSGFYKQKREADELERKRQAGIANYREENHQWEQSLRRDVDSYRVSKKSQSMAMEDNGREFQIDQREKEKELQKYEFETQEFIRKRNNKSLQQKNKRNGVATLSEEEELDLQIEPDRVPWSKRKFGNTASRSSGGGSTRDAGVAPSFRDDSNYSPPPPPAPMPYDPGFDSDIPPPPPPLFDEEFPPPPPPM